MKLTKLTLKDYPEPETADKALDKKTFIASQQFTLEADTQARVIVINDQLDVPFEMVRSWRRLREPPPLPPLVKPAAPAQQQNQRRR